MSNDLKKNNNTNEFVLSFLKRASIDASEELLSLIDRAISVNNPVNKNELLYVITSSVIDFKNPIIKKSYPAMNNSRPAEQFDLPFWTKLVYKIYDDVATGKRSLASALDYHSNHLPEEHDERLKFKKWFSFYQSGENKKYAEVENIMKKEAYQFPLMGSGQYQPSYGANAPKSFNDAKDLADKNLSDTAWKKKLDKALRSIDRLLRDADDHISAEEQDRLLELYYDLNKAVRTIRFHVTAADYAHKTAGEFRKLGFYQGADILSKFAQEAPPVEQAVTPPEQMSPIEEGAPQPVVEQQQESPSADPFPGGVDLAMAIQKIEEVAGILAERKIIRTLAEFDIILDKMGVASMFPELSEAQSRLIDAFSYSLVRVSKMMGMLSSGKSINEIASAQNQKIQNQITKEVNKTLSPEPADGAQNQIQQEFQGQPAEQPASTTPAQPVAPAPAAPVK